MSNNKRRIYGLIGYPVKHSLSPAMHNTAFKHLKARGVIDYDAEYILFEVKPEELEDFLLKDILVKDANGNSISTKEICGFNVTVPHKVRAREILEMAFPYDKNTNLMLQNQYYVKLSGAINTVKREGNMLQYWNTDAAGFLKSLKEQFDPTNKNILLIGCGGAARAIISSLSWKNEKIKKIYIYDVREEVINSAREYFLQVSDYFKEFLKDKLQFISSEEIPQIIKNCDLLINATPIGMKKDDPSVIDKKLLEKNKNLSVYDVVYNRKTQLIKDAQELGLLAVGGLGMLLYQGMLSFELWTGKKAPQEIMQNALAVAIKSLNL